MGIVRSLFLSLILLCNALACGNGDFKIGATRVEVRDEAVTYVWPDLPEALAVMQEVPGAPDDTWDVRVTIYPPWHPVGVPGHACEYEWSLDWIQIRAGYPDEETTADGCLPHEIAHRWRHKADGLHAGAQHDAAFWAVTATLTEAARTTWAHR